MPTDTDDSSLGVWSALSCVGVGAALALVVRAVPVRTLLVVWTTSQLVQAGALALWALYVAVAPDRRLLALYAPTDDAHTPPLARFIAVQRRDYRLAQTTGLMFYWAVHTAAVGALYSLTGLVLLPAYISVMMLITLVATPWAPVLGREGPSATMLLAQAAGCTASFAPRAVFGDGERVPEDDMLPLVIAHAQAELAHEDAWANPAAARLSATIDALVAACSSSHEQQYKTPQRHERLEALEDLCAALDGLAPTAAPEPQPRRDAKCPLARLRRGRDARSAADDPEKGAAGARGAGT